MDNTLYISDMDGTLLGPDAALTPYAIDTINRFIEAGGLFSIATARSWQIAKAILAPLKLNIPLSFNNGAMLYDPGKREYVRVHEIPAAAQGQMIEAFSQNGVSGFFYVLDGDVLKILHPPLQREIEHAYRERRWDWYEGQIFEQPNLLEALSRVTTFFCVVYGERDELARVQSFLDTPEITSTIYSDVYTENLCFMDVYASSASKEGGMRAVAELCGADRMVAFGDNFNDIPMLLAADESYVTANGVEQAKQAATGVIGACKNDGVPHFLAERYGL